jgi:hypothetical protein
LKKRPKKLITAYPEGKMKKFILLFAFALVAAFPLVAMEGYESQTIHVDVNEKNLKVDLIYTEETKNLTVVYTLKYKAFDEGDAVVTTGEIVQKFVNEHGYKHFKTYTPDVIKYHKDANETEFTRFFVLSN